MLRHEIDASEGNRFLLVIYLYGILLMSYFLKSELACKLAACMLFHACFHIKGWVYRGRTHYSSYLQLHGGWWLMTDIWIIWIWNLHFGHFLFFLWKKNNTCFIFPNATANGRLAAWLSSIYSYIIYHISFSIYRILKLVSCGNQEPWRVWHHWSNHVLL